ncbi:MAG: ABC transporter ATP-binding protein [Clostridia bacterium]|nr:ABC transporter ATP-binding protein [Clostridia bacterium]
MKRLLGYLKPYWRESVLGPLFKLCEATLELIVPLVIAAIVDRGIAEGDRGYILKMALLLALMGLIGLAFSVTAQFFCARASVGFVGRIRSALFAKLGSLSYSDIDRIGTSTMITRMSADSTKVQNGLNLALRLLLRSPFVVFGAAIMAFTIDFKSALTFVAVIPLLSIVVFGIMLLTMPMYKRVQGKTDALLSTARENLDGVRVIRAFGKEEDEIAEFREENQLLTTVSKRVGRISALMNPLTFLLINAAILVLIYAGAVEVNLGNLSQGQVLALYNYMSQILVELIKLANLIISISKALASATRIADVLDVESTDTDGKAVCGVGSEYAVELRGVYARYAGAPEAALENISFSAKWGETVGIIGGTGSGKSTLVNLIPAFYRAEAGEVLVDGVNVCDYDPRALREMIGMCPQRAVLFSGTIRDNLKWRDPNASDEEILEAVKIAQASDVLDKKGGLDAVIEEGGRNLSGGQRQRLTIARALVGKPKILVLDDSASALDFATDAALRRAIADVKGKMTVFIVSQRASSVMNADKIILLDDGAAVGIGTHAELMEKCELYREIYYTQFKKGGSENE